MEIRNLDKNILYHVYDFLSQRDLCQALEIESIYHLFADIPNAHVAASIHRLVQNGWLRQERGYPRLYLTDSGCRTLRATIPAHLLPTACDVAHCPHAS